RTNRRHNSPTSPPKTPTDRVIELRANELVMCVRLPPARPLVCPAIECPRAAVVPVCTGLGRLRENFGRLSGGFGRLCPSLGRLCGTFGRLCGTFGRLCGTFGRQCGTFGRQCG